MENKRSRPLHANQILISLAALVVVIAGISAAKTILVPFFLSGFIAIISAPPLFWLIQRRVPQSLALLIVISAVLGIGTLIVSLVASSVSDFSANIPEYEEKLRAQAKWVLSFANGLGLDLSAIDLTEIFNPGAAMKFFAGALSALGNALANTFLILMTVVFILLEASSFPKKLIIITGGSRTVVARLKQFMGKVKRYMAIKTVISLATGVLVVGILSLLGVDYPILWGVVAFVMNYVPNIGSIIAAIPAVLLTMVQLNMFSALLVGGAYVVINLVMGNVIEPKFMGSGLGLSTLVVFLSLLFWGWLLGPVGMLLSVPLTITAKIALESRSDTKWIAILLGP